MGFRFGVLGPVTIWQNGEELPALAPQQQAVLALLVLRAGQQVSVDDLCTAVWGEDGRGAGLKRSLRTYVSRLRSVLDPGRTGDSPLITEGDGYVLRPAPGASDLEVFDALVARARTSTAAGDARSAFDDLSAALALWRGEALTAVPGPQLATYRVSLAARRLDAVEARLAAMLALGMAPDAVAELPELVEAHPLRESLHRLAMLALYQCGRQAEALELFERLRRRLNEALGVRPGPELARLHLRILRAELESAAEAGAGVGAGVGAGAVAGQAPSVSGGDVSDAEVAAADADAASASAPAHDRDRIRPRPAQLPAASPHFTGRDARVRQLESALTSADGRVPPTVTVTGIGGVGKTALAVHVAHRLAERYSGGQLYVDLRGTEPEPADPADVLIAFLTALGVPEGEIPERLDERSALFRTVVADRRLLLVLDNAESAAQLRPLIPGTAGCAVLATCRSALWGLGVGTDVQLDVLEPQEALALFTAVVGAERVAPERPAALDVVAACGFLPLAVHIAAARLAARTGWTVADLAGHLADAHRRLARLQVGEQAVRASFELSYAQLDEPAARAFRLLAGPDVPTLSVPLAAALLGVADDAAEDLVERLVDLGLLETPEPGRYRYHDLLRLFAREKTGSAAAAEGVDRMLEYFYAAACGADPGDHEYLPAVGLAAPELTARLRPEFPIKAELPSLLAALGQVGTAGPAGVEHAGALLVLLDSYWVDRATYAPAMTAVATATMARATQLGAGTASARAAYVRGSVRVGPTPPLPDCVASLRTAVAVEDAEPYIAAQSRALLGYVLATQDPQGALALLNDAAERFRAAGNAVAESSALYKVAGCILEAGGSVDDAREAAERSLVLDPESGVAMMVSAFVALAGERWAEAVGFAETTLAWQRSHGFTLNIKNCLDLLALGLSGLGRHHEAIAAAEEALAVAEELGWAQGITYSSGVLGLALFGGGDAERAVGLLSGAVRSAGEAQGARFNLRWLLARCRAALAELGEPTAHDGDNAPTSASITAPTTP